MYLKMTCIAASVLALSGFASAGIVYSGEIEEYTDGSPVSIDIAGLNYEFGIEVAGPADYAYITTTDEGAGIFVPIANELLARNFAPGHSIGTLTSVLNMYPLGPGGSNSNLIMHDYITGEGEFSGTGYGYVGFGFGSGIEFNYGWMEFITVDIPECKHIIMTGWAYNDEVNQSIIVGQIPAPGALGLLAIVGLAGRRRRQG
jgi:hypothetical protein